MGPKIKTIQLVFFDRATMSQDAEDRYLVESITDSTEYKPGKFLTVRQAQELCDSKHWKVTMVRRKG